MMSGNLEALLAAPVRTAAQGSVAPAAGPAPAPADSGNSLSEKGFLQLLEKDLKAAAAHGSKLAREILGAVERVGGGATAGAQGSGDARAGADRGGKGLPAGTAAPAASGLLALLAQLLPAGTSPSGPGSAAAGTAGQGHGPGNAHATALSARKGPAAEDDAMLTRLFRLLAMRGGTESRIQTGAEAAAAKIAGAGAETAKAAGTGVAAASAKAAGSGVEAASAKAAGSGAEAASAKAAGIEAETRIRTGAAARAAGADAAKASASGSGKAPAAVSPTDQAGGARLAALLHAVAGNTELHAGHGLARLAGAQAEIPLPAVSSTLTVPGHGADANASSIPAPTAPTAPIPVGVMAPVPSATPTVHAVPAIPLPPGHPGWAEALGSRVQWVLDHQLPSANVRLNPPGLGPLEIRVSLHQNQAQINFATHHAAVRDAVEAALPRLRELFAGSGLNLSGVNISHQSLADHGSGQQGTRNPQPAPVAPVTSVGNGAASPAPAPAGATALGLVDYYV